MTTITIFPPLFQFHLFNQNNGKNKNHNQQKEQILQYSHLLKKKKNRTVSGPFKKLMKFHLGLLMIKLLKVQTMIL